MLNRRVAVSLFALFVVLVVSWTRVMRSEPADDERDCPNLLFINGFQYEYLERFLREFAQTISCCEIVVVHPPLQPAKSRRLNDLHKLWRALLTPVRIRFHSAKFPHYSPTIYPVAVAGDYMERNQGASRSVLFVEPTEVTWCGNVFSELSDPSVVYTFQFNGSTVPFMFGAAGLTFSRYISRIVQKGLVGKVPLDLQLSMERTMFPVKIFSDAVSYCVSSVPQRACLPNGNILATIDRRACLQQSPTRFGDSCPTKLLDRLYFLNETGERLIALSRNYVATEAILNYRKSSLHHSVISKRYAPVQPRFAACPFSRPSAVVSIALGYSLQKMEPFVRTFLGTASDVCSVLVVFVDNNVEQLKRQWSGVRWVDVGLFPPKEGSARCNRSVVDFRFEVYFRWLDEGASLEFGSILITDSRDVLFQGDPFRSFLRATATLGLNYAAEWIYVSSESFLTSSVSSINNDPYRFFEMWMRTAFGKKYVTAFRKSPLKGSSIIGQDLLFESFPILCAGLLYGRSSAMMHLLALIYHVQQARSMPCGMDQALVTALLVDGIPAAKIPVAVIIANPEYSGFRNMYERAEDILVKENVGVVNCDGDPYSLLHQVDRVIPPWISSLLYNQTSEHFVVF